MLKTVFLAHIEKAMKELDGDLSVGIYDNVKGYFVTGGEYLFHMVFFQFSNDLIAKLGFFFD